MLLFLNLATFKQYHSLNLLFIQTLIKKINHLFAYLFLVD